MPEELDVGAVESGLESMFGMGEPPEKPAPVANDTAPQEGAEEAAPDTEEVEIEAPADGGESDEQAATPAEFLIEVDGEARTVSDPAEIKELLQKGYHYTKNSQANAAQRESLIAQSQQLQQAIQYQQVTAQDMAQLRAIEGQLAQYEQVNLAALFETDFIKAGQIKEQRDQLREARNAIVQQLNLKTETFRAGQAQAAQQIVRSEMAALQAKLPEMRDSTKAAQLQQQIASALVEHYGLSPAKVANLGFSEGDHALFLIARDAMLYRQLKTSQDTKLKQVRTAPPVVKPGAQGTNKGVPMQKARQALREMGRKGNSRAQEALAVKMLNSAFK